MVVAYTPNPTTEEAEAAVSLWVWGQPGLESEFQDAKKPYLNTPPSTYNKKNHSAEFPFVI